MDTAEIGNLVRRLRKESAQTREGLAEAAGVKARMVERIETGQNVTARALLTVLDALGVEISPARDEVAHFVIVARRIDSSRWVRVGSASTDVDGIIRASVPLYDRTLFLKPVASAAELDAWPYEVPRETVFPKREP